MDYDMGTDAPKGVLVWGVLAMVLRLSSWCGVAPLKFERRGGRLYITRSKWMSIYSYSLMFSFDVAILAGLSIDLWSGPVGSMHLRSPISSVIWCLDVLLMALIITYGIVAAGTRMQCILDSLINISKIISNVSEGRPWRHEERIRSSLLMVMFIALCVLIILDNCKYIEVTLRIKIPLTTIVLYLFYFGQHLSCFLLKLQFVCTALLAHTALKMINGALLRMLLITDIRTNPKYCAQYDEAPVNIPIKTVNILIDSPYSYVRQNSIYLSTSEMKRTCATIRRLSLAYIAICDVMREIDRASGVMLFLMVTLLIIHLLETSYYLVTFTISGLHYDHIVELLMMSWILFYLIKLAALVQPQHMTDQEIVRTNALLGRLLSRAPSAPLQAELRRFCQQVALNQVAYAPLGLFTLDRPFVVTVLACITTYLIVLVQFKPLDKLVLN